MAGVRHHILPRFLLKGFASRVEGAKAFAWVYRRNCEPDELSLRDIAVERNFYGRNGELNADPAITAQESEFAALVDDLRERPDGTEIAAPAAASLIAHLCVRTKHLRESVSESTDLFLDEVRRYLSDPENLKALILSNPDAMKDAFEKESTLRRIPQNQRRSWVSFALSMTPVFMDLHPAESAALAQLLLTAVKNVAPAAVRNGHIKALSRTVIPEPRAEHYSSLRWFVRQSPVPLILGDVGCLFEVSGPKRYKSLNDKDDHVQRVSLPLLPDRVLVGTALSAAPHVDFAPLTEAHARCSRDFFVCSSRSERMKALADRIGEDAALIGKEEMSRLVAEMLGPRKA
jgi:hypothetical protein